MEITLDRFGRVVIPRRVREHLGLGPGTVLEVEEREQDILLRPRRAEPDLVEKGGVVVFTGEAAGDLETALDEERRARAAHLAGWSRR